MKAEERVRLILDMQIDDEDSRCFVESYIRNLQSELEKVSAENRLTASRLKLALRAMNEFKHDLAHQILANAVEDLTQKKLR